MSSRLVKRRLAGLLLASVLFTLAACSGGDSAPLGKPVELRFREVLADPYPDEADKGKPPATTVAELEPEAVFDKVGDEAAEAAGKLSAVPTDIETLETLEPFAELSAEEVGVLPPKLRFFVPTIGCAQLDGGAKPTDDESLTMCDDGQKYLLAEAAIDNSHVESAKAEEATLNDGYVVTLTFTKTGSDLWADLTAKADGRQVAILVDGKVLAAPVVQGTITGGVAQISGEFTQAEAEKLAAGIEAGTK